MKGQEYESRMVTNRGDIHRAKVGKKAVPRRSSKIDIVSLATAIDFAF
jgi:hypothetical protein